MDDEANAVAVAAAPPRGVAVAASNNVIADVVARRDSNANNVTSPVASPSKRRDNNRNANPDAIVRVVAAAARVRGSNVLRNAARTRVTVKPVATRDRLLRNRKRVTSSRLRPATVATMPMLSVRTIGQLKENRK